MATHVRRTPRRYPPTSQLGSVPITNDVRTTPLRDLYSILRVHKNQADGTYGLWYLAKKEIEAEKKGQSAWNHYPWNGKQSSNPPSSTPSPPRPSQNIPPPSSANAYRLSQANIHGHYALYYKRRLESQGKKPCTESELREA